MSRKGSETWGIPRLPRNSSGFFAGYADPFLHLIEVLGEGAAAGGGEAVFGARDASFEKFYAGNVLGLFELAGVDAQVAVGGFQDTLEVVEAQGFVGGESADDAEADALVDEAIEFGEFGSDRVRTKFLAGQGRRPSVLRAGWDGFGVVRHNFLAGA